MATTRKDASSEMGFIGKPNVTHVSKGTYTAIPSGVAYGVTPSEAELQARSGNDARRAFQYSDIVFLVILLGLGIAFVTLDFAWTTPSVAPYGGLKVPVLTELPFWGFQFSSWSISLAFHWAMLFIALALITVAIFSARAHELFARFGVDFYYFAVMVMTGPALMWAGCQMLAVQEFFQLFLEAGIELARVFGLFVFMMDNRGPLLALIKSDKAGMSLADWIRIYASTRWVGFAASFFFWVWSLPLYFTYGITYTQQFGATTPRSILIIVWLVFYPLLQVLTYVLFALRYGSEGSAGKNMRGFACFGVPALFLAVFAPVVTLACLLIVPTLTTGY